MRPEVLPAGVSGRHLLVGWRHTGRVGWGVSAPGGSSGARTAQPSSESGRSVGHSGDATEGSDGPESVAASRASASNRESESGANRPKNGSYSTTRDVCHASGRRGAENVNARALSRTRARSEPGWVERRRRRPHPDVHARVRLVSDVRPRARVRARTWRVVPVGAAVARLSDVKVCHRSLKQT